MEKICCIDIGGTGIKYELFLKAENFSRNNEYT